MSGDGLLKDSGLVRSNCVGGVVQAQLGKILPSRTTIQRFGDTMAFQVQLAPSTGGVPLPAEVRSRMESTLGGDFSNVRIHVGPEANRLGAVAFTWGSAVHFAPGYYNPSSPAGERLLAHELIHVLQQKAGRVTNPFGSGVAVVQDRRLEAEAERAAEIVGRTSIQRKAGSPVIASSSPASAVSTPIRSAAGALVQRSTANIVIPAAVHNAPTGNSAGTRSAIQRFPLVGNTATDLLFGSVSTMASNLSWLVGQNGVHKYYSPVLSSAGFATAMFAILPAGAGHIPGGQSANNAPANAAWDALSKRKASATGRAYYIRAHLLRDKYFGGHAQWNNLAPLTNRANNPSPLSHLHQVENLVQNARAAGHTVGYRVVPIYGGWPGFDIPRTLVNTLVGLIPVPWLRELRNILYYESQIPTAFWTSWWYHDAWNPFPSIRVIRNWTTFDESAYYMIHSGGHTARTLTWAEWILLAVVELAKGFMSAFWPSGAWAQMLGLLRRYSTFSFLPSIMNGDTIASFFDYVSSNYPRVARIAGNFMGRDILEIPRRPLGSLAGFVPSAATLAMGAELGIARLFGGDGE